jgi:hypothetical protein
VAALCAAGALVAGQASAASIVLDWSGTVTSGVDTNGVFGAPGQDLSGEDFDLSFTFDLTLSPPTVTTYEHIIIVDGGTSPDAYSATLTIGAGETTFLPSGLPFSAEIWAEGGGSSSFLRWDVASVGSLIGTAALPDDFSLLFGAPYSGDCTPSLSCTVSYSALGSHIAFEPTKFAVSGDGGSLGLFIPVPEPASWALMITGFGLAGGALRRRRAALA